MNGWAGRGGALVASYIAACLSAAVSYTLLLVASVQVAGVEHPSELPVGNQLMMLVWFAVLASFFIATMAFLPAICAYLVLRLLRLRDVFSHAAAGVAVSAVAAVLAARMVPLMDKTQFNWVIAVSGAVGGAVFWGVLRLFPAANGARLP